VTTIIPFIPSNIQAPTFPLTLDGKKCNAVITWNISSLRYFVNIYDSNGNWIITTALVSSPPARNAISAVYDPFLNIITVEMHIYSGWPIPYAGLATKPGTMIDYTLEGFQPATYNGKFRCLHVLPLMFTFPMATDPGPLIILGTVSRLLNMVDPVMKVSSMVYRNGAFEISP
jgi:hypothetical protein